MKDNENYGNDDEQGEVDNIEEWSDDSDNEQEFDQNLKNYEPITLHRDDSYFVGKDNVTKWKKHCQPKNVLLIIL